MTNKTCVYLLLLISISIHSACEPASEVQLESKNLAVVPGSASHTEVLEVFAPGNGSTFFSFTPESGVKLALFVPCGGDHKDLSLDCGITRDDATIRLAPRLLTLDPNDACGEGLILFCEVGALGSGQYRFIHDQASVTIEIPSRVAKANTRFDRHRQD